MLERLNVVLSGCVVDESALDSDQVGRRIWNSL